MRNAALTIYVATAMPSDFRNFQHGARAFRAARTLELDLMSHSSMRWLKSCWGCWNGSTRSSSKVRATREGACSVLKLTKFAGHRSIDVGRESSVSHVGGNEGEQSQSGGLCVSEMPECTRGQVQTS